MYSVGHLDNLQWLDGRSWDLRDRVVKIMASLHLHVRIPDR
jgi:hypothetical protein